MAFKKEFVKLLPKKFFKIDSWSTNSNLSISEFSLSLKNQHKLIEFFPNMVGQGEIGNKMKRKSFFFFEMGNHSFLFF